MCAPVVPPSYSSRACCLSLIADWYRRSILLLCSLNLEEVGTKALRCDASGATRSTEPSGGCDTTDGTSEEGGKETRNGVHAADEGERSSSMHFGG